MENTNEISWDEATNSAGFIKLEESKMKTLVVTNYRLEEVEKEFNGKKDTKIEFQADVIEEDGVEVDEKLFTTTSNRLKNKLRPIFENKQPNEKVKIQIMKVGDKFATQYSVVELPMEEVKPKSVDISTPTEELIVEE